MKKRIVIEVENELQETWLQQMFEREIEETEGAISNEKLFAKGSDGEQKMMHKTNVRDLYSFKTLLEWALRKLKGDMK